MLLEPAVLSSPPDPEPVLVLVVLVPPELSAPLVESGGIVVLGVVVKPVVALESPHATARLAAATGASRLGRGITRAYLGACGGTSLRSFQELQALWTQDDALVIEVVKATDTEFDYNVHRCRYAETYKAMGLGEIGHLLSCNRDGAFCEGYDPRLKLDRSQTIMQGASHCDFKYSYGK